MTPLQEALLAIDVLVDALHATSTASPEAEFAAQEAFAAVRHLGFDARHTAERKLPKSWATKPHRQGGLFP